MAYLNGRQIAFNPIVNSVVLDDVMSSSSINGVQNRVIKSYVDGNFAQYYQGTWVPTINYSVAGTAMIASNKSKYWRVGNMLVIRGDFVIKGYNSEALNMNDFTLGGFPYYLPSSSTPISFAMGINFDENTNFALAPGITAGNAFACDDYSFNGELQNREIKIDFEIIWAFDDLTDGGK